MNTADLCAEGRELYAEYINWMTYTGRTWLAGTYKLIQVQRAEMDAYRRFKEHVDGCPICSRKDDE